MNRLFSSNRRRLLALSLAITSLLGQPATFAGGPDADAAPSTHPIQPDTTRPAQLDAELRAAEEALKSIRPGQLQAAHRAALDALKAIHPQQLEAERRAALDALRALTPQTGLQQKLLDAQRQLELSRATLGRLSTSRATGELQRQLELARAGAAGAEESARAAVERLAEAGVRSGARSAAQSTAEKQVEAARAAAQQAQDAARKAQLEAQRRAEALRAQGAQAAPAADPGALQIRVYPIGDLVTQIRQYPLVSTLTPLTKMAPGRPAPDTTAAKPRAASERSASDLIDLITHLVDPFQWATNGGSASIALFGDGLVISAPPEVHTQIDQLLEDLRQKLGPTRVLRIELRFITLTGEQALPLTSPSKGAGLTDEVLQHFSSSTALVIATGYSGQTLHVAAGKVRQTVTDITPIVGTQSSGYQSNSTLVLAGISAELSTSVTPDGKLARLDLAGSYCSPQTTSPVPAPSQFGPVPDPFEAQAYQFSSSAQIPVNTPVLISSTSIEPSGTDPARQLLLVVRIVDESK